MVRVKIAVRYVLMLFMFAFVFSAFSCFAQEISQEWSYEKFQELVSASGRKMEISEKAFDEVQKRREEVLGMIERYLRSSFKKADPNVIRAFREVPREYFQFNYQNNKSFAHTAYEIPCKIWALGYGSTLSGYYMQAYMTQLARPTSGDVVLEIGTGSGYQVSILSRIVKEAYSIEIIQPLGDGVAKLFEPLGYSNVHTRVGDGYFGWPEVEGGFDIIMATCVAKYVSPELLKQLKPGGRLIIPVGQPFKKGQFLYVFTKDENGKIHSKKDMEVSFIPMVGEIQKKRKD